MIDLTTVKTYEVLPSLAELHEQNLILKSKNKNLKGWLIGAGVLATIGILIFIINKNRSNGKKEEQSA